jgi:SAM-dependent methyltransferase
MAQTDVTAAMTASGPMLVFGGPYSNLEATAAVLAEARRRAIAPDHVLCTGDLAAYCADPQAVIDLVRGAGIRVVMGNCEESLATAAGDCGCGYAADTQCAVLSTQWYPFADRHVDAASRAWMGALPRRIDVAIAGRRLVAIHGAVSEINRFVFATSDAAIAEELAATDADGVIGGHCGLPFTRIVGGRLWHNAGVVGVPANDGTPRVWFSVLTPARDGIAIAHHALDYDHGAAARKMRERGLPAGYAAALESGLWPSCDVLTPSELARCGQRLEPGTVLWRAPDRATDDAAAARWPARERAADDAVRARVSVKYAAAARAAAAAEAPVACCEGKRASWSPIIADLYDAQQTCCLPDAAVAASLGCGNPTAIAALKSGEVVLDLGCGGGIDVLLAARQIGPTGHAYGVDMTDDMLALARANQARAGARNVDFVKGTIDAIPLPDRSLDVIISNCVVNLAPDKAKVFADAYRVLKPGGRLAISDVVTRGALPAAVRRSAELWLSCVAGALEIEECRSLLAAAGFREIAIEPTRIFEIEDVRTLLDGAAIDVDALAPHVAGRIVSASIQAVKPPEHAGVHT